MNKLISQVIVSFTFWFFGITIVDAQTFFLDDNGVTIKCIDCSPGDQGEVNGIIYTAVGNNSVGWLDDNELATICTSLVTDFSGEFSNHQNFNTDISHFDVSNVTNMSEMFEEADSFNQDLSSWDVSNVINMSRMFYGADSFNQDLSSWDVSNVNNISRMFSAAYSFNQPLDDWNVSNVDIMDEVFRNATSFNQELNSWNVSNVIAMRHMFRGAASFNQDLSNWDVSNVELMEFMFYDALSFDQDLSNWDVSSVTNFIGMFSGAIDQMMSDQNRCLVRYYFSSNPYWLISNPEYEYYYPLTCVGCTDVDSYNFNPDFLIDDDSCLPSYGMFELTSQSTIYYNDTLEVKLSISGGEDIYAAYASLQYDSTLLEFVGGTLEEYFDGELINTPEVVNNGVIDFGVSYLGSNPGANGDGEFYTLHFVPIAEIGSANTTEISVIYNEAYSSNGLPGGLFYPETQTVEIIYEAEVWPGDLNNDYEVTVSDILPIGYFYGETGPQRPDASLEWEVQPCPLWGIGTDSPVDDFYKVFADGNGDGQIQLSDQVAVGFNLSQSIPGMVPFENVDFEDVPGGMIQGGYNPVGIFSEFNPSIIDLSVSNELEMKIYAFTDTTNYDYLHGFSLSLDFSDLFDNASIVSVDFSGTEMGDLNNNVIALNHTENAQLDVAMTHTTNNYPLGYFELFKIAFEVVDIPEGDYQVPIYVSQANDSQANLISTTVVSDTLTIVNSNNIEYHDVNPFIVYPNPTYDCFTVDLNTTFTTSKYCLYNSSGEIVDYGRINSSKTEIQTKNLPKGSYMLEVLVGKEVFTEKILIY